MKVLVLMGPPGAGKGTQADLLVSRLGCKHVSTGNLLRAEIASGSQLGKAVKEVVDGGGLVSDDLLFSCLDGQLKALKVSGARVLLVDGVPRSLSQVDRLDSVLKGLGLTVDAAVALVAPIDALVKRFARRWTCKGCGFVAAYDGQAEADAATCPSCSSKGKFFRRPDDVPEAVERRLGLYARETEPILAVFEKRGCLSRVNGLRAPEHVYVRVASHVIRLLDES